MAAASKSDPVVLASAVLATRYRLSRSDNAKGLGSECTTKSAEIAVTRQHNILTPNNTNQSKVLNDMTEKKVKNKTIRNTAPRSLQKYKVKLKDDVLAPASAPQVPLKQHLLSKPPQHETTALYE